MTELVGRRFGVGVWFLAAGLLSLFGHSEASPDIGMPILLIVTAATAALMDVLRPNRLRLHPDRFELITTWGGRRRFAWSDISPASLVALQGKGGRKYYVVRFRYLPRRGRRSSEVTLPQNFEPTPLALLLLMNEFRDRAVGARAS